MNKTDLVTAQKYLKAVIDSGIKVQSAYVFGSRVRGTQHRFSDIDTCIVSTQFGHDRQSERVRLLHLTHHISELIEPHPFSPRDFDDANNLLAKQIKATGVKLL